MEELRKLFQFFNPFRKPNPAHDIVWAVKNRVFERTMGLVVLAVCVAILMVGIEGFMVLYREVQDKAEFWRSFWPIAALFLLVVGYIFFDVAKDIIRPPKE